jgi:hypothetical protein
MAKTGAKRRKRRGGNKSVAIREYLANHSDEGPSAVARALSKPGFVITPSFVSNVKLMDKKKGRRKAKRGRPPGSGKKRGRRAGDSVSMSALMEAKKLAAAMGGIEKAKAALNAYSRITG